MVKSLLKIEMKIYLFDMEENTEKTKARTDLFCFRFCPFNVQMVIMTDKQMSFSSKLFRQFLISSEILMWFHLKHHITNGLSDFTRDKNGIKLWKI